MIGDMLAVTGKTGEALATYRKDLAIAERLVAAEPGNSGYQQDVVVVAGAFEVQMGSNAAVAPPRPSVFAISPRDAYPAYWAPFVVVGEEAPR